MKNLILRLKLPDIYLNILLLLLSTDLFFLFLHVAHKIARIFNAYANLENDYFSIYYDRTAAETFQYIKEYWCILLLVWLIIRYRKFFLTGWAMMFVYLLIDDMLSIHEALGSLVLKGLNLAPSHILFGELRYQDFGELGVSLFFGALFLSIMAFSYYHGDKKIRTVFHYLVGFLIVITAFGVGFDFANRIFEEDAQKLLFELTRLIEEFGEMIGVSFICWYIATLTKSLTAADEDQLKTIN